MAASQEGCFLDIHSDSRELGSDNRNPWTKMDNLTFKMAIKEKVSK